MTAREAALAALGRGGERTLEKLEAAGLTVVRRLDRPAPGEASVSHLDHVQLQLPSTWTAPYPVTVITNGDEVLHLHALRSAAPQIAEAFQLHAVMGHRLDVTVNREEALLLSAVAVPQ